MSVTFYGVINLQASAINICSCGLLTSVLGCVFCQSLIHRAFKLEMKLKKASDKKYVSLSYYEILFASLTAGFACICVGLIVLSWLSVHELERGKQPTFSLSRSSSLDVQTLKSVVVSL